jgi:predicted ester cyclase
MLVEIYDRWLEEVWSQGRYEVADELLHEDLVDHNAVPGQPAGRAGDVWAARQIRAAFPDLRFTRDVGFESGDTADGWVTGRWTMNGTHTGELEFLGIPPTGRPVTMSGQEIFRVRDGRFAEVWHAEDVGTMMRALDLEPPRMILRLAARRSARKFRKERGK